MQVSGDGSAIGLYTETGAGGQEVLQAPISWQAGTSHNLVLDFNSQTTALYVDGALAAQGAGVASVPPPVGELVLGSTLSGANTAGADFEEFYSFSNWLSGVDVSSYYSMTALEAALGPISGAEEAGWSRGGGSHQRDSLQSPNNVFDADTDGGGCVVGGPPFITNMVAVTQSDSTMTVKMDIQGGTNGVFYDLYCATNLGGTFPALGWTWLGQVMTCNTYTLSNQPPNAAFYAATIPTTTMVVAFGDDNYGQCNVLTGVTNAVAVAAGGYFSLALLNPSQLVGCGDDTYGEIDIPAGLTNVVSIAAGLYHGVAVLADGSVTNWGSYYGADSYFCSVTNRTYASAPPTSNVVAVAAGAGQDLALLSNGTCVAWGFVNVYGTGAAYGTQVPSSLNLTNVSAVACGWQFNVVLSSNGAVKAWGYNDPLFGYPTTVPSDLSSNVVAIAAGGNNAMALRADGTVEAWGDPDSGATDIPSELSNVAAVATGGEAGLALQADGTVVTWGDDNYGATNIPTGVAGVKAISAGFDHDLVIESGLLTPVILTQPTDQAALAGGTATFSVEGESVAGTQYQWQLNGVNLTGETNATLTLTNTQEANNGNYQVIISADTGSITSSVATFALVVAPNIVSTTSPAPGLNWINYAATISVAAADADTSTYPLSYQWQLNGTNIAGATNSSYTITNLAPAGDGNYTVTITNVVGSTNVTLTELMALPGMVEAWGDNTYGECNRPATLTNASAIAAGEYQSVAVTDSGTVAQWGKYSNGSDDYSVTNFSVASAPPTSGVIAVAAGLGQALALMTNDTVTAWGLNGAYGTQSLFEKSVFLSRDV